MSEENQSAAANEATEPKEFQHESVSPSGAPTIVFSFRGETCKAELAGAKLYGEVTFTDNANLRITASDGVVLADLVVNARAGRTLTENIMDVGSALLWSHWRFVESMTLAVVTRPEFASYRLNDEGQRQAQQVRKLFSNHLTDLEAVIGSNGREVSIVKTKLEEACMFAMRALAKNAVQAGRAEQD